MEAAATIATDLGIGPGSLVGEKYRVLRIIGHGGMGLVVEAIHEALEQRVAIKFLRLQEEGYAEALARFLLEAKALAQFKSIHFPRVTDVSTRADDLPYFVMEYLDGRDLGAALAVDGVLAVPTAVDYSIQACEAMAEAFAAGIIHRDIKPSNLFLTPASDGSIIVKLLDFGISKHAPGLDSPALNVTRTRALMGSPRYMAPEQMRSMRRVDHRADIWSLGVVLHEALTGHPPFVGETLPEVCAAIAADDPVRVRQLRRDVPIELQDVILRCLAKDPELRYRDVGALALDLMPFAPPDAAVAARRVGRIIAGASSVRPAPPVRITAAPPPVALSAASPDEESYALQARAVTVTMSVPPPRPEDDAGKRQLRRWALAIVGAVAIPAFVVGALLPAPALVPEPPPIPSATPSSSARPRPLPAAPQEGPLPQPRAPELPPP